MNIILQIPSRPTFRPPSGRTTERPATPAAATLSIGELKQIVAAMLG
ncbi:hypothetical protein FHS51_003761 [Sphingobium wenxiniae]|jgi:hypothetical protein|uniref:Uncharacterized protein n=1 Tax=Sphingobium baderi LL03 TaxID=1114964 RepID=T0HBI0_9SPHN|nr:MULTISPECIES: hypothetical protein [Sphingobium]EQA96724.1 hypothetical protein L485_21830 [Sphingobium baderi LL03]MBB6193504.1 hypothetical protein [Sphingobium wenxiniae]WRD77863.1 hypothetical protein QQ987_07120 [Sphingobium baderi]